MNLLKINKKGFTYNYNATKWEAIAIGRHIVNNEPDSRVWRLITTDGEMLIIDAEYGGIFVVEDDTSVEDVIKTFNACHPMTASNEAFLRRDAGQ